MHLNVVAEPVVIRIYDFLGQLSSVLKTYSTRTYHEYLKEYRRLEKQPGSTEVELGAVLMSVENAMACRL